MLIYLMRHGETVANRTRHLQGWLDSPLTDFGRELATATGKGMKKAGITFDIAFTSPLCRATETCRRVLDECGCENLVPIEDYRLREGCSGKWEDTTDPRIDPSSPVPVDFLERYFRNAFLIESFPGGDNPHTTIQRTQDFLRQISVLDCRSVLVSSHGFCLRCMLNSLFPDPSDFWQGQMPPNCSVCIVESDGGRLRLLEKDRIYY